MYTRGNFEVIIALNIRNSPAPFKVYLVLNKDCIPWSHIHAKFFKREISVSF